MAHAGTDGAGERSRTHTWADPQPTFDAAGRLAGLELLQGMASGELPPPPIMSTLDFEGLDVGAGWAKFWLAPGEHHLNPVGIVHGGVAAGLLDLALGAAVQSTLAAGVGVATVDLHVSYLRPLTTRSGRVQCEARVIRVGRRMASAEASIADRDGRIYAHATASFMVMADAEDAGPADAADATRAGDTAAAGAPA